MWAICWTQGQGTAFVQTLERVKVNAADFSEAMTKARSLIPSEARIIDCEPVGKS